MLETEYACPKCNRLVVATPEQIIAHIDRKVDLALPRGLVYKAPRSNVYGIVSDGGIVESGLNSDGNPLQINPGQKLRQIYQTHGINQKVVFYLSNEGRFLGDPILRNSRELKRDYARGKIVIPTLYELAVFQEIYAKHFEPLEKDNTLAELLEGIDPESLIRTTPRIERLIRRGQRLKRKRDASLSFKI
jgi:hypothetical protein